MERRFFLRHSVSTLVGVRVPQSTGSQDLNQIQKALITETQGTRDHLISGYSALCWKSLK